MSGQGKVSLTCGHYSRAKEYFEAAISICRDKSLQREELVQHVSLSRVLCALEEYEDAHSVLVSARELLPSRENPSQDQKNLEAELVAGLGELSMAKGDYSDALQHFQTQRRLLVGEEQVRESRNIVKCLWSLGDRQRSYQLLDSLDGTNERMSFLETRALLCRSLGKLEEAVHFQELRVDLARRESDRVSEMGVLCNLADSYLLEGHCDQALLHFDQALLISRDISHVAGECTALVGLSKCYYHMSEYDTCLERCQEVAECCQGKCSSVEVTCNMHLTRARAHLALEDADSSVRYARTSTDLAKFHPILLATSTAVLGQGLLLLGDKVSAREAILSSCSQFEILLLQKNLDFVYEGVSVVQERSYSSLLGEERENLWVEERVLRWERARYVPLSSPFPAHNTLGLGDVTSAMVPGSCCVVIRVDNTVIHTWVIKEGKQVKYFLVFYLTGCQLYILSY